MFRHGLITCAILLLLFTALPAHAANGPAPQSPPPKSKLDVTMNVVPLTSDIESTVVQTITLPVNTRAAKLPEPASSAHASGQPPAGTDGKPAESARASVLRQTIEARREAAEAAKEARKDRDNSSAPDNDAPP